MMENSVNCLFNPCDTLTKPIYTWCYFSSCLFIHLCFNISGNAFSLRYVWHLWPINKTLKLIIMQTLLKNFISRFLEKNTFTNSDHIKATRIRSIDRQMSDASTDRKSWKVISLPLLFKTQCFWKSKSLWNCSVAQ